jgi:hypothetical protein
MAVDRNLVEQIEMLTRSDFRASVNATRRATLAIGALILHWGQFDSSMGSMIEWMRARHRELGLDGFPNAHPSDQAGQLNLLRKLIQACSPDGNQLREFDRIRQRISRATAIRDDLVHGALGLGNQTGTDEGLYIMCAPYRKPKKSTDRILPAHLELRSHLVSEIFRAADDLWNDLHLLEGLVRVVLAADPLG